MSIPKVRPPLHKNRPTTLARIQNFISPTSLFKDVNLFSKLYEKSSPLKRLTRFSVPQPIPPAPPHGSWKDWPFERVVGQVFIPAEIGEAFGPTWATHWFKVEIEVPPDWVGKPVHLRWITGSESTLYSEEGRLVQGLNPKFREEYPLPPNTHTATFYIEMACNHIMGAGPDYKNGWGDEITPPSPNLYFTLTTADIAIFNEKVFSLYTSMEMLHGIASSLDTHIGNQALFVANQMVNYIQADELEAAATIASEFFASPSGEKKHKLYAMGHCHIDTAWLWPYDETIRKCARSFSSQLELMKIYPDFKFVCSQAVQLQWIKETYPSLFKEIKEQVGKQFIAVGGTWCEMDGNIPSGEAFMRQYLYGQTFFKEEFGVTCKEFWLPDTFGYSAQIPQMINHVGIKRFLTQKMSWNLVNKFPNHSFVWEGLDGSQIYVHFPPGDSYGMSGTIEEILKTQNNSEDKGRCNSGIFLFGHGDGGGGPTRTIIERIKRVSDLDGLPSVTLSTPDEFFEEIEKEKDKFYKWVGELYLELHNGTYTSQAKIKWFNRKGEMFLREVEQLIAIAAVLQKVDPIQLRIDHTTLSNNWKLLLLNQFHDVLPGSCIQLVAEEAWRIYEQIFNSLKILRNAYCTRILGTGSSTKVIYNPLPWKVRMVVAMKPDEGGLPEGVNIQRVSLSGEKFEGEGEGMYRVPSEFGAALVELEGAGFTEFKGGLVPEVGVSVEGSDTLTNKNLKLQIDYTTNLSYKGFPVFNDFNGRDVHPGRFYIYDDLPIIWDAWDVMDYHLETKREPDFTRITSQFLTYGPIVGVHRWSAEFGNGSSIVRYTIMKADSDLAEYYTIIDWHESHKMLKVEFPVNVLSREATFEIQYGHLKRPTHMNTSWDMAKFEVCGHKWVDVSNANFGVSLLTDSKYGYHVRENIVQLSLLRSPKNPDANCDMHKHYIYYGILPHDGDGVKGVVRKGYELNQLGVNNIGLLGTDEGTLPNNFVICSEEALVIEACKLSEDNDRAIVVRIYESFGGGCSAEITLAFTPTLVQECNGLEQPSHDIPTTPVNSFPSTFRPFEIKTFLIHF